MRFSSGATRRFDLVVGADGVHSAVRRLAFGPEEQYVRPLGAYTAYFTVPDPGDLDQWFLMYNAGYCASPLSGLGTSLALVSAYVLAGELAAADADHTVAFARYQHVLRDYVKQCQALPPGGVKGFAPQTRPMIAARNLSMRMMTHWPMRDILAKQFGKADAISLPAYAV